MTRKDPEQEAHWIAEMAKFEASGLNGAEYCQRNGIKYTLFADWKRRFLRAERSQAPQLSALPKRAKSAGAGRAKRSKQTKRSLPKSDQDKPPQGDMHFAPITVVDNNRVQLSMPALEILLPNSLRILVRDGSCLALLSSVVSVLDVRE